MPRRELTHPDVSPVRHQSVTWAWVRLLLGTAQMFFAAVAAIMLFQRGPDRATLTFVLLATGLMLTSKTIFGALKR